MKKLQMYFIALFLTIGISPLFAGIQIQVKVNDLTKIYDGTPLEATYSYSTNAIIVGDVLEVAVNNLSRTAAGSNSVEVTSCVVRRDGIDVTSEYEFEKIPGSLFILRRAIEVTPNNGYKTAELGISEEI